LCLSTPLDELRPSSEESILVRVESMGAFLERATAQKQIGTLSRGVRLDIRLSSKLLGASKCWLFAPNAGMIHSRIGYAFFGMPRQGASRLSSWMALFVHAFVDCTPDVSSQSWSVHRRFAKRDEVLASL
jgi:hypothetical protein